MNNTDYMTNAAGHLVPTDKVREEDRLEDDLVRDLFEIATEIQKTLEGFKATAFQEVGAFVDLLSEKYGVAKGGKKGNITLTSFDGLTRIQIAVQDYIQFGAQLQIAKSLVDECINEWSDGANSNLKAIVDQAFRVDKNARVNTQAILGLRRLNITDEKWVRAMDAITESIRVMASKQYIRFYYRPSPAAEFEAVTLDIAKV
jgi:hypothetical protein